MVSALKEVPTGSFGSHRLILIHSWYTDPKCRSNASFMAKWIAIPIIKPVLENMNETEQYLRSETEIDWTTVLPPGLGPKDVTDKEIVTKDGDYMISECKTRMNRGDVARFLLRVAEDNSFVKTNVAIGV